MIIAREDELVRLRRQVTELREELAEWRRQGVSRARRGSRAADPSDDPDFIVACRRKLDLTGQTARTLAALLDASPRVVTRAHLLTAMRPAGGEDTHDKIVDVYVSKLRRGLMASGLGRCVETHWALGYSLAAADAARIRESLGL